MGSPWLRSGTYPSPGGRASLPLKGRGSIP